MRARGAGVMGEGGDMVDTTESRATPDWLREAEVMLNPDAGKSTLEEMTAQRVQAADSDERAGRGVARGLVLAIEQQHVIGRERERACARAQPRSTARSGR